MTLTTQQMQFATATFDTPLFDQVAAQCGKGIDAVLNGAIEKIGGALDACTAEVRGMGKASVLNVADKGLSNNLGFVATPVKGDSENTRGQGRSREVEKSIGPEMQQALSQSVGCGVGGKSMECCHCDNSMSGQLSPLSASAGIQTHAYGRGV